MPWLHNIDKYELKFSRVLFLQLRYHFDELQKKFGGEFAVVVQVKVYHVWCLEPVFGRLEEIMGKCVLWRDHCLGRNFDYKGQKPGLYSCARQVDYCIVADILRRTGVASPDLPQRANQIRLDSSAGGHDSQYHATKLKLQFW